MISSVAPPYTYNILFLGEIQSGKSTLIERIKKKYADSGYIINTESIGSGKSSYTSKVNTSIIYTNLPSYFVSSGGMQVNNSTFFDRSQEDYEDELNDR